MSDRKIAVKIEADTSAYLEAMRVATEATDRLRDSIREVRREREDIQSLDAAEVRYAGMPFHTVFTDAEARPGLTIKVNETRPGHVKVDIASSDRDQRLVVNVDDQQVLSTFVRHPEA